MLQRVKNEIVFEVLFSMAFGLILALKFPLLTNVTLIEKVLFKVEHIVPLLVILYVKK